MEEFFDKHTGLFLVIFCIWYLMVHSNLMLEMVLDKIPGAVAGSNTTTKGTLIQLTMMTVGYIILLMFVSAVV